MFQTVLRQAEYTFCMLFLDNPFFPVLISGKPGYSHNTLLVYSKCPNLEDSQPRSHTEAIRIMYGMKPLFLRINEFIVFAVTS